TAADLDGAAAELRAAHPGAAVRTLPLDVAEENAVATLLPPELAEQPIDLLVNSAGTSTVGEFTELDPAALRREMDVNYFGAAWTARAVVPHFLERGQGHLVNVGSTASLIGIHGYAAYAPSKFALYGLSEVLRAELRPRGIGVTIVLPTSTRTPMLERELEEAPPETRAIITSTRILEPREVAEATLAAVARNRFEVIPGRDVALQVRGYRIAPAIGRRVVDRNARR
ncbi:MAG TPA: SDR family NAD(P)-dependent oxidoreductase, partial [Thermoleophilaceae bacterium]|nr:SDR family NAD(P)-dependent oxidoreductase [Thermoleophilaceae bacterium]